MNKEKQIEEKAIEEMAKVIEKTEQIARDAHCGLPSPRMYAQDLYWHGYRKQSEGEWAHEYYPYRVFCSNCKTEARVDLDGYYSTSTFCPHCGAKMKGGAEETQVTTKKFFSPEEVRKMSKKEVRENYQAIMNSMKEWK